MKNFDTRAYNISDFIEWDSTGLLELSPDFQRRSVWSEKAKSYLIDTIIKGKPIPKILISQKLQQKKNVRVVVDGQQRLRAILGFYNGDFKLSRVHNADYPNVTYNELPSELQNDFLKYELGVDLLFDVSYEDILDIFARINSYTVTLKKQEIFNAKYVGYFKQISFIYGLKYVQYFLDAKILTKSSVSRMAEAELSSDLFVSLISGVQTNKNIESFYKRYEDDEGELQTASNKFDEIMSYIGAIYPAEELGQTNWKRVQLFYTLFTSVGHLLFNLNGLDDIHRMKLTRDIVGKVRIILDEISYQYDLYISDKDIEIPAGYKEFIHYTQRGTTDTAARVFRSEFVCDTIKSKMS